MSARSRATHAPVVEIDLPEPAALGAEFVRWEVATAVAGALLEINPFDEPERAAGQGRHQGAARTRTRGEGAAAGRCRLTRPSTVPTLTLTLRCARGARAVTAPTRC